MATVERATSSGGIPYKTAKTITYDEVEANYVKTTTLEADYIKAGEITFTDISGGTATLGGAANGNGVLDVKDSTGTTKVKITNEGITMADDTKIVGGDGVLSTYFFSMTPTTYWATNMLGWDYNDGDGSFKYQLCAGVVIPADFTVVSATLFLKGNITELHDVDSSLGFATASSVRLYKDPTLHFNYVANSGFAFHDHSGTNTNALGTGGVTIGGEAGTSHIVSIATSNFAEGFNYFILQSDMTEPSLRTYPTYPVEEEYYNYYLSQVNCIAGIQVTGYLK